MQEDAKSGSVTRNVHALSFWATTRSMYFLLWAAVVSACLCACIAVSQDGDSPEVLPFEVRIHAAVTGDSTPERAEHVRWIVETEAQRTGVTVRQLEERILQHARDGLMLAPELRPSMEDGGLGCTAAIAALEALRATNAIPFLLEVASDGAAGESMNALTALQRIQGLSKTVGLVARLFPDYMRWTTEHRSAALSGLLHMGRWPKDSGAGPPDDSDSTLVKGFTRSCVASVPGTACFTLLDETVSDADPEYRLSIQREALLKKHLRKAEERLHRQMRIKGGDCRERSSHVTVRVDKNTGERYTDVRVIERPCMEKYWVDALESRLKEIAAAPDSQRSSITIRELSEWRAMLAR